MGRKTYEDIEHSLPKRQKSLFDDYNYSLAVKKLSRFSNIIK